MEKKEPIAKNVSSGAEKVEAVAKETEKKQPVKKTPTKKKVAKKNVAKKKSIARQKAEKEKARAEKRVQLALAKEKRKQVKEERKAARKWARDRMKEEREERREKMREARQVRKQQQKEEREKREATRRERREVLRGETKKQREARKAKERAKRRAEREKERERAYALKLERRDARLKKREQRLQERERNRGNRTPGFGGWLAAVISLGAVCLTLSAVVTYGAVNLAGMTRGMEAGYRGTLYEFVGSMDDMDEGLAKARISASEEEQGRLLRNILVEARVAETALEKLPLSDSQDGNLTAFINRTAMTANYMLDKLSSGTPLSERDMQTIETLYEKSHEVRAILDELSYTMNKKDMRSWMKEDKKCRMYDAFERADGVTKAEPYEELLPPQTREGGITTDQAEELCRSFFNDYSIKKIEYVGETLARGYKAYNFVMHDKDDVRLFAEISSDGKLVGFDYYKSCQKSNFDNEHALVIAKEFLSSVGYEDMTLVFSSEEGTNVDFDFVYETNGVEYKADKIQVKVCKERGIVTAMNASRYISFHRVREDWKSTISMEQAQGKLNEKLNVLSAKKVVLPSRGKEISAYEFICSYNEEEFYVYVNAQTGEEEAIYLVEYSAQGKRLK